MFKKGKKYWEKWSFGCWKNYCIIFGSVRPYVPGSGSGSGSGVGEFLHYLDVALSDLPQYLS